MREELYNLYLEIKDYLIEDSENYQYKIAEDTPEEIKEKFKKYKSMQDDLIINESK